MKNYLVVLYRSFYLQKRVQKLLWVPDLPPDVIMLSTLWRLQDWRFEGDYGIQLNGTCSFFRNYDATTNDNFQSP